MQLILCIRNKLNTTQEKGRKKSEIRNSNYLNWAPTSSLLYLQALKEHEDLLGGCTIFFTLHTVDIMITDSAGQRVWISAAWSYVCSSQAYSKI